MGDSWFKHKVFRHFWWVALGLTICLGAFSVFWIEDPSHWKLPVTLFGGLLSALYFVQKQKLEETRLFASLFQSFNYRYDEMNGDLNEIIKKSGEELTPEDKALLYDYFNLCAEEYLFYKRGYVPHEVWKSWQEGMRYYMRDPLIRKIWEEDESRQGSSYSGLEMPGSGPTTCW